MALSRYHAVTCPTANGAIWTPASDSAFVGGVIGGYSLRNTGAAKATVDVYDNTTNSGTIIFSVELGATGAANASHTYLEDCGVYFTKGLYVAVSVTTVLGSFFLA